MRHSLAGPGRRLLAAVWLCIGLVGRCQAQFPSVLNGANLTTITSPLDASISIAYTQPRDVCTTVFANQEQYAGWVTVPGETYPVNLFFWFIGARETTSMLTVYLNGGPGASSMFGLFAETGPCEIVEFSETQLGTIAREWGWDRASNMLFVDQPNQVGFSYDTPTNGTLELVNGTITVPPMAVDADMTNSTLLTLNGTFASQNASHTANTTATAARAVYHLMQGFLAAFPQYNPPSNGSVGVNLFAESYGGHYGPVFAETWQAENAARLNTSNSNSNSTNTTASSTTVDIHIAALGLINACVDDLVQAPHYAAMMVNNTYGYRAVPLLQAGLVNASFYKTGGCREQIVACRAAVAVGDPTDIGANATANSACATAQALCTEQLITPYTAAGRSYYDIAHALPDSFPPAYYYDYLNSASVQQALGAPVNFSATSTAVSSAFVSTGDWSRDSDILEDLAALLQAGVRVGLVYGDRDFICNWLGGEAVSLAVAAAAGSPYADHFPAAGYAPIIVNDTFIGGVARQFANLSFSRVYQSGHFVPASQPETAFQVFARIILGTDLGTGESVDLSAYNTSGPLNATSSLSLPPSPDPTCFVRDLPSACADDQITSLQDGLGVVINGIWYAASSDWPGPASDVVAAASATSGLASVSGSASPVSAASALSSLTGIYTATATPAAAVFVHAPASWSVAILAALVGLFSCLGAQLLNWV